MVPFLFLSLAFSLSAAAFGPEPPQESQESLAVDSVRGEMTLGRYWHAARRLWAAYPDGPGGADSLVLLFSEAEAGWGNWSGVRALLEEPLLTEQIEDTRAWYLLGRALESAEEWEVAETAYDRVIEGRGSAEISEIPEVRARRARVRAVRGRFAEALVDVQELGVGAPVLGGWAALEAARGAAGAGARAETMSLLSSVLSEDVRRLGWSLPARALLAAADSAGAEAAFWSILPALSATSDQGVAWEQVGTLRLARGDSLGARGAFHQVLQLPSPGGAGVPAAVALLELGFDSVGVALAAGRALASAGRGRQALEAYRVHEELLDGPVPPNVLLARAQIHFTLGEVGPALSLATQLGELGDPAVSVPALVLRAQTLRRLGRGAEALAVEDIMVERFPQRAEAVEILYLRADALKGRGDLEGAIRGYRETVALAPAQNRAGEARMKMAQILLSLGREEEAVDAWSGYRGEFPEGRRWDEAAFWEGHTLLSLSRIEDGTDLFGELLRRFPLSYYAIQAGVLLGEGFDPSIPAPVDSLPFPSVLREGLDELDLLRAAGFDDGVEWQAGYLAQILRRAPEPDVRHRGLLRLAIELNSRGLTREGINLGWELRREGVAWDTNLLSTVYPFPYQDLVLAEAGERGLDPYLMAGLIRQESAFWKKALSRADARGLMQVLPSTGRELARASGPGGFDPDEHLFQPEINIHLGMAFNADLSRRFNDAVHIVLCAYNAGPTRAIRWRQFPEAQDVPRFVEKIPFTETRGYVKAVLLNWAVYTWLYGGKEGAGGFQIRGMGDRLQTANLARN
jgi:soluble lytic murein transglycosylase